MLNSLCRVVSFLLIPLSLSFSLFSFLAFLHSFYYLSPTTTEEGKPPEPPLHHVFRAFWDLRSAYNVVVTCPDPLLALSTSHPPHRHPTSKTIAHHNSSVDLTPEAIRTNILWLQRQQDFDMGSSYQSLREGLEAALRHTRPTDTQDSDFEASKLPPFLQELLDRYPPNFGDETPEAGTDDSNTAENDSIAEESSSALSQACGTESDHDSIASTSSDSNELSSVEIEAFIDYYVAEKFRKVQDRTSTNSDATELSAMTEHNDEQTFQLKAEKSALEDRLNNLRITVHGSIVSETGATASATKKQCQCLDETIKHICRINGLLGIAQDEKTNDPMLQLPKSNQEAETHETNSRDRCSSVNAKSWGEIQKDQVSDCALLKVLLSKDVNFLNELSFFGSGRSMHPLRRELDTALNDMREGNGAARQAQDFDHLTMTSFAELFIAWLWCIEVPIGGFLPEKISSTIYLKEAAPLIVARFLRDVKSEVGHSLSYAHQLISGSNHLVSLSGAPILLDGSHQDILRPHQLSGVRFLWREIVKEKKPGGALLAHEMGLGKTLQM
ncbi:unnamed protein product [Penicillium olsonii]|nr:unnamed protein product [Penicillium olsonii]